MNDRNEIGNFPRQNTNFESDSFSNSQVGNFRNQENKNYSNSSQYHNQPYAHHQSLIGKTQKPLKNTLTHLFLYPLFRLVLNIESNPFFCGYISAILSIFLFSLVYDFLHFLCFGY